MHIIGLIAEYNPLHLGHIYQINKIKELYPNSIIILVTNSTFTQRGEVSIINKWNKTKLCLDNKIDLIFELPFVYATQSADLFAKGALEILNHLQIDTLVFGSESNDINMLYNIANTQINNPNYNKYIKEYLAKGLNYPTAISKTLEKLINQSTNNPNDLLAISYIKEIIRNNYKINFVSIKRTNNYHSTKIESNIVNASLLRKLHLNNTPIDKYLPPNTINYLYKNLSNNNYFTYLKYKIISIDNLSIYQTVDEGIDSRIKKAIKISNNWEELIQNIKTKRYTYNKINRMLIHILTSLTKEECQNIKINYLRLLGFTPTGQKYLNKIKKDITIPIITTYKKNISKLLDIELRATSIYNLETKDNLEKQEYTHKPIIKL